jgi:hypothetical protein
MSVNVPVSEWRLRTAGGIPYKLKTTEGSFAIEDSGSSETYIIRASDLMNFVNESFPYTVSFGGYVVFARERGMPGFPRMYSKTVKYKSITDKPIDPFGTDPNAPDGTYEQFLEVTIDYGPSTVSDDDPDQDDPETFLEISSSASTNFLANTAGSINTTWGPEFGAAGTAQATSAVDVDVPATVIETSIEWSFKWPTVPYQYFSDTLIARMRAALGKVNSGPTALFHNAPAETILFLGYSLGQSNTWRRNSGVTVPPLNIEFKFLEKGFKDVAGNLVTHNHFYRKGVGWRRLYVNGSAIFSQTNLDSIFRRT